MKQRVMRAFLIIGLVAVVVVAPGGGTMTGAEDGQPVPGVTSPGGGPAATLAPMPTGPGGPGFFAGNPLFCQPYAQTAGYSFSGKNLSNPGSFTVSYECPVYLPNGATVNKLVVYYYDNSASDAVVADLVACPHLSYICYVMGKVSSTGAADSIRYMEDATIESPAVNLADNSYLLQVSLPPTSTVQLAGYRVDYGYEVLVPATMKNAN